MWPACCSRSARWRILAGARGEARPTGQQKPGANAPPPRARSHRIAWIAAGATAAAAALVAIFAVVRAPGRRVDTVAPPVAPVTAAGARTRRAPHLVPPPMFGDRSVARVESIAGEAFAISEGRRRGLEVGAALAGGDGIEAVGGPGARLALALEDGASLELRGEGQISGLSAGDVPGQDPPRVRVSLERGTSIASVPARPPGATTLFVTPIAEIRVRAGALRFLIEQEVTRVWLRAGAAEVRRLSDGQHLALEAGQSVVVAETGALVAVAGPRALLVRGSDARGAELDRLISARLEAEGFAVSGVAEAALEARDLADKALVVISSSSAGRVLAARLPDTGLRELAVPVVNCESLAFVPLGMATRQGVAPQIAELYIEQPAHLLAAGKTGKVQIASVPVAATWGHPGSGAVGVAAIRGRRRFAVFGYERGAPMIGLPAPGRRVSCFLDPKRVGPLNDDAWDMFEAAVRWAVGP